MAQEIVASSIEPNRKLNVTGVLLYDGTRYLQVLEGECDIVLACYARILRDRRHHDVRLILRGVIERREFAEWSMTLRMLTRAQLGTFASSVNSQVEAVADLDLRSLLVGFAMMGIGHQTFRQSVDRTLL